MLLLVYPFNFLTRTRAGHEKRHKFKVEFFCCITFFTGGGVVVFGTSCATEVLECPVPLTLMSSIKICRLGMVKPNSRTYLVIEDIWVNKKKITLVEWSSY